MNSILKGAKGNKTEAKKKCRHLQIKNLSRQILTVKELVIFVVIFLVFSKASWEPPALTISQY